MTSNESKASTSPETGNPETDSDRLVRSGTPVDTVLVSPVDSAATEPVVSKDQYAEAHGAARTTDPADDATVPKRASGGDHANESPEIALSRVEIPLSNSNDQLRVAAEKRANADGSRADRPIDRRAAAKSTTAGK